MITRNTPEVFRMDAALSPESVFRAHRGLMYSEAFRILNNAPDAEDAVGGAALALVRHLGSFRGESRLQTWLVRVVRNAALNVLRKRRNYVQLPNSLTAPEDSAPDERGAGLGRALAAFPDAGRIVADLAELDGNLRVAAARAGISVGAYKSRLRRARVKLRGVLAAAGG
jgi:RNA polymerase sigma-70 factor (ECF subfamily)